MGLGFITPHPIRVWLLKRYQNGWMPSFDRGRVLEATADTGSGMTIRKYLKLKIADKKIPLPETSFYQEFDGIPYLGLAQIDRNTFWPLSIENGQMLLKQPIYKPDKTKPIYQQNPDGTFTSNEKGEKTIVAYELKKDALGDPVLDRYENVIIGAVDIMLDNGVIRKMPVMNIVKTYDPMEFMASEQERNAKLYGTKGFWDKYGGLITIATLGVLTMGIIYIAFQNLTPMFDKIVGVGQNIAQANAQVADSNRIIIDRLAQIMGEKVAQTPAPSPF